MWPARSQRPYDILIAVRSRSPEPCYNWRLTHMEPSSVSNRFLHGPDGTPGCSCQVPAALSFMGAVCLLINAECLASVTRLPV